MIFGKEKKGVMRRYNLVPYERFTKGAISTKYPVSFLLGFRNGEERKQKIYEENSMKKHICEVHMDFDGDKDYFVLTFLDEGHRELREVLLKHRYPGQYRDDETRALKFSLRESGI